jgi:hypothetical protein
MAKLKGKDLTDLLKKFSDGFGRGPIERETSTGQFQPVTEATRLNAIQAFDAAASAMRSTCAQNVLGVKVRDSGGAPSPTAKRVAKKGPAKKGASKKGASKKGAARR